MRTTVFLAVLWAVALTDFHQAVAQEVVAELANAESKTGASVYAMDADGSDVREVASIPGLEVICSPEISPDGKWLAIDGWQREQSLTDARLLFINLETGEGRDFGLGCMPNWSPDGQWFAFSKYGAGVFLKSFDAKTEKSIDADGWAIQLSPDGKKAAYSTGGGLVVYDLATEKKQPLMGPESPYQFVYHNCKWSPDSTKICFKGARRGGGSDIAIINIAGESPTVEAYADGDLYNEDIAWHPNGERILLPRKGTAEFPGRIEEFNPDEKQPPRPLQGQPTDRHSSGMSWSSDGKTLYFISEK